MSNCIDSNELFVQIIHHISKVPIIWDTVLEASVPALVLHAASLPHVFAIILPFDCVFHRSNNLSGLVTALVALLLGTHQQFAVGAFCGAVSTMQRYTPL